MNNTLIKHSSNGIVNYLLQIISRDLDSNEIYRPTHKVKTPVQPKQ